MDTRRTLDWRFSLQPAGERVQRAPLSGRRAKASALVTAILTNYFTDSVTAGAGAFVKGRGSQSFPDRGGRRPGLELLATQRAPDANTGGKEGGENFPAL